MHFGWGLQYNATLYVQYNADTNAVLSKNLPSNYLSIVVCFVSLFSTHYEYIV